LVNLPGAAESPLQLTFWYLPLLPEAHSQWYRFNMDVSVTALCVVRRKIYLIFSSPACLSILSSYISHVVYMIKQQGVLRSYSARSMERKYR
jgi:hypothetical protein